MARVQAWTRLGGVLLCVSALACQGDDGPLILTRGGHGGVDRAASSASDAGPNGVGHDAGAIEADARDEGRPRDDEPQAADREQDTRPGDSRDGSEEGDRDDVKWRPSDAQIGKLLRVANKAEIDQANAALPKLSDPSIRAFAQHTIEAHNAADARQSALLQRLGIEPTASVLSANLEFEASGVVARLEQASAAETARLYIDSQVTVHNKALDTLDEVLLPYAQDASLQSELSDTRIEVQAHLDEAWALADALAKKR